MDMLERIAMALSVELAELFRRPEPGGRAAARGQAGLQADGESALRRSAHVDPPPIG